MARLYLDENIGSRILALALENVHHTVAFCRDLGHISVSDDFHLYAATKHNEVLVTHDTDFLALHGALFRFANDHGINDIHSGILVLPQESMTMLDLVRYIDAFFAADLPIANRIYIFRMSGSWVQNHPRPYA